MACNVFYGVVSEHRSFFGDVVATIELGLVNRHDVMLVGWGEEL